ncbi:MAG: C39 family peptidase [Sphingopyxis sp.]|nr:C39 family peptidase [Sphingopyxis sp.]
MPSKPISFRRKFLWALAALVLMIVAAAGVTIGPLLFERNHYAHVVSVERRDDYRDPELMAAAWALPAARLYRRTSYEFQGNQSFCGPASLANVLRSMGRNVSQQQAIDGSPYEPWFGILIGGMTLDELAALTQQRSGQRVSVVRDQSLTGFRAEMARSNDPAFRYIVNFHRGPIFGRGHGHFSPVLGYLADRDLVLVGDVNADYRPFLVSSERLWRAANTIDTATGKARGLIRVDVRPAALPR